jgi:hypothetical protein
MKRFLPAVALFLSVVATPPVRAQSNIYEWSAAINLGLGLLNQMMGFYHQMHPQPYGYGIPHGGQGFGTFGPPGWHLRTHPQGWGVQPGWGQMQTWGQQCPPQLMHDQMGRHALVDPCTGQVVQWVR